MRVTKALCVAVLLAAGCGDDTTGITPGAGGTGGTAGTGGTGGSGGSGVPDAAPSGPVTFRIANLVADLPEADICLAPHGTTNYTQRLLGTVGYTHGVKYREMTAYNQTQSGDYDARVVAAGAANCNTALLGLPDQTNLAPMTAGNTYTIALMGRVAAGAQQPFQMHIYQDETNMIAAKVNLRFIHAAVGVPAVDVGIGMSGAIVTVFTNVAFAEVGKGNGVDSLGYAQIAGISGGSLIMRTVGTTTAIFAATGVTFNAGTIVTVFAIGDLGGAPAPLQFMICIDGTRGSGPLTECNVVP
jgi:hypothetical protein